ncbi:hypothetical protein M2150_001784 [Lachnospiraceae bacterium PM6-15]|uniref:hypothetical protein n=1 Tax=Ohessyouella blattaphilus TaxID=2949333 RepID=UPI003E21D7AF
MDYSYQMLEELQRLENISEEYAIELRLLSKRIRRDFWNDNNAKKLLSLLKAMNNVYIMFNAMEYFDLDFVFHYIKMLAKYCVLICPGLDVDYYNNLIDEIQMESARIIIEKQWDDINSSEDGLKSFKDIFDDVFMKCLGVNKEKFFHKLKDTDKLCRVVGDLPEKNKKERFIPWDATTNNRWNPPGKGYLYLSFSLEEEKYSDELTLNEYICLEEYRAKKNNMYYFCDFKPIKEGMIFDLSYNDTSLRDAKRIVEFYEEELKAKMLKEMEKDILDPSLVEKYSKDRGRLEKRVKDLQLRFPINDDIIAESYAKQYLKMICSCIYKKVDESDETKKEEAYKSFHALSQYLEGQGVSGIIFPCTRTDKVVGKNLVLFNKYDAEPIESTIREYYYK